MSLQNYLCIKKLNNYFQRCVGYICIFQTPSRRVSIDCKKIIYVNIEIKLNNNEK